MSTNGAVATNGHPHPKHHHIWLVTGPAGCGKSTVAKHVADSLNMPYIEGDEVCLIFYTSYSPSISWALSSFFFF